MCRPPALVILPLVVEKETNSGQAIVAKAGTYHGNLQRTLFYYYLAT